MSGAVEGVALLPCPNPWCEEVEGVEASRHITTEKWHVCCDDCMIEGPWADSYDLAIAAWNTRTTPPARSYADEDVETQWEVWEDDLMVASSTDEADARHYLAVYSQDGPVRLLKSVSVRTPVA